MIRAAASLLLFSASLPAVALAQTGPAAPPEQQVPAVQPLTDAEAAMKAHVMFLASDQLKGREAGTADYEVAAQYVASQFYAAGLQPAGDKGSYFQRVPLIGYKTADKGNYVLTGPAGSTTLEFGKDYIPSPDSEKAERVTEGDVVFVGQGVVAPHRKRDDYAGVDVRGKIVALFSGAPASFDGEERAHFGSVANKIAVAAKKGAIGVIVLQTAAAEQVRPFERQAQSYDALRVTWGRPDGSGASAAASTPSLGVLSQAGAAKLFAGSRTPWEQISAKAADANAVFKPFALKTRLKAATKTTLSKLESSNVAGLLPGSDPAVKDEVVVLTAHLDHVGVGRAKDGDTIYNGAMDNAVGIASLIEEAKRFKASGKPPRRSILFLAVTAEEKGLVGSDYFANNPTLPKDKLVANVNLDMPIITYKFEDVIAFGSDRTTLGPMVRQAAANAGATFSPDPMPEQGLFVRSDHYRFVQQGIPSVFLWPGTKGPGKAAVDTFLSTHYHQASDQLDQVPTIDWSSGVRFIDVNYHIAREIADAPERPRWNKGDFFGTLYGGIGAQ
ncbi:M28 family metallopeptidase [Sphingomonas sp. BGYR3]|nr:M28 family metallopeptidase [Sphingomonas sp. BGYR3]MDG5489019.1 M28 family metallopeptidase [Sphingomonas sp. BGYR3]